MEQTFLDYMILLQLTKIVIFMGEHNNDWVLSCGNACIFFCDNSKEHDSFYDNRCTHVEIVPFVNMRCTTGTVK